tara:strand:+ start:18699 stop:21812 length:3114 start_codon:yes stop_codon:yes gene_type:complete
MPLPPEDNTVIVEKIPRNLGEGETALVDVDGTLEQQVNHNGVTYRTTLTSNPTATDTLNNFQFTDTSIGGGNFNIDLGENAIIVRDFQQNQRGIFGQITSTGYGLQVKDQSGSELVGLYGTTNKISGWTVTPSAFTNTSADGSKHISLLSGLSDNLPRLEVKDGSTAIVEVGTISANLGGIKINNSAGTNVVQIDSSGTTQIAGWEFTNQKFQSGSTGSTRIELDATKSRVSVIDSSDVTKTAMGYLDGLQKNNSIGHLISSPTDNAGGAVVTVAAITDAEHENAFPDNNGLAGLLYWVAKTNAGAGISQQTAGIPIVQNTYNTITLAAGSSSSYANGYTSSYQFVTAAYNAANGIQQSRYFKLVFGADDYGFWAIQGDKMRIDGDVTYESGDWLIESDGAVKFFSGEGKEIMRLGTFNGEKGLFIGSDVASVTPLAQYTGSKILIGDESGQHMKYTTADGLEITGEITVEGDTSNNFYSNFQYGDVGSVSLPTENFKVIAGSGGINQYQGSMGMQFYDTNTNPTYNHGTSSWSGDAWDCGWFTKKTFKRADIPTMTWDVKLLKSASGSTDGNAVDSSADNRFEMIGWNDQDSSANYYSNLQYGVYFSRDDCYWYAENETKGAIFENDTTKAGNTYRIMMSLTSTGCVGRVFENGDFTTPIASKTFTNNSSTTTWYASALQRNGVSAKLEHQQLSIGNVAPSVPTRISGGLITTGKIQSTDNKTFFDLDNDDLRVNDGNNDRIVVGKLANNNYGMRVSYAGSAASGSPNNDDLMFSTEFALPKYQILYMDGREKRGLNTGNDIPFPTTPVDNSQNNNDYFYLRPHHSDDNPENSGYSGKGFIRPFNGWAGSDTNRLSIEIGENKINFPYLHDKSLKYARLSCVAAAGTGVMMSINTFANASSYYTVFCLPDNVGESGGNYSWGNNVTTVFGFTPKASGGSSSDNFDTQFNSFVTGSSGDFDYTYNGTYGDWQSFTLIADVSGLTHGKFYTISIHVGGFKTDSNTNVAFKSGDEGFILQPIVTGHGYEFTTSTGNIDF